MTDFKRFVESAAGSLGISADQAGTAAGGLLGLIKDKAGGDLVGRILGQIPELKGLLGK